MAILAITTAGGSKAVRSIAALKAKNRFGELLDAAQREPVTIERHGRPVAVLISAQDYEEIEALKLASLRAEIAKGLADIEAGRTIRGKQVFRDLRKRLE
jgi:prevent-host-death family protein